MQTTNEFKKHTISRNCDKEYDDYHNYKKYLEIDFQHHCAYCNMHDEWVIPLPYQIDHFIPRKAFEKAGRNDLDNDYNNLVYACPICNRLKSDAYEGEIPKNGIANPFFYNPVDIDYNLIFKRDDMGRIWSDDELGKAMIKRLQLYRPTKQMAWFLDELKGIYDEVENQLKTEQNPEKIECLIRVQEKFGNMLYRKHRDFVHSYITEKTKKRKK